MPVQMAYRLMYTNMYAPYIYMYMQYINAAPASSTPRRVGPKGKLNICIYMHVYMYISKNVHACRQSKMYLNMRICRLICRLALFMQVDRYLCFLLYTFMTHVFVYVCVYVYVYVYYICILYMYIIYVYICIYMCICICVYI